MINSESAGNTVTPPDPSRRRDGHRVPDQSRDTPVTGAVRTTVTARDKPVNGRDTSRERPVTTPSHGRDQQKGNPMTTAPTAPDGGWKSRRARRRAELAQATNLLTDARIRHAKQSASERAAGQSTDPMSWPLRILAGLVALIVLAVAAVIGVVIIGAQIGFYQANLTVKTISFAALGISTPLDLPTFTPIATEGVVWATTLLAVVMVLLNRTATLWTQSMWFFASIAAFVNTWHSVFEEKDLFGGVLRGGLSLAGPFLVHLFILWCRHLRTGRTLAQARADTAVRWASVRAMLFAAGLLVGRHVAHPVIAGRALGYWLGVGNWTYSDSWAAASLDYRRRVQARLDGTRVGAFGRLWARMTTATEQPAPVAVDARDEAALAGPEEATEAPTPPVASVGLRPAFTAAEVDRFAALLADPSLTAEAFGDQREQATDGDDREATERRPATPAKATEQATEARPNTTDDATGPATGTRPKSVNQATETATEGDRAGDRRRPVGRAQRRPKPRPEATDIDVSDLLPVAREVATELGDRLNRDALLEGLRDRGLSVGGRRRAAIYGAIQSEFGKA
jgi:hypothetical protein